MMYLEIGASSKHPSRCGGGGCSHVSNAVAATPYRIIAHAPCSRRSTVRGMGGAGISMVYSAVRLRRTTKPNSAFLSSVFQLTCIAIWPRKTRGQRLLLPQNTIEYKRGNDRCVLVRVFFVAFGGTTYLNPG